MQEFIIETKVKVFAIEELCEEDKSLVDAARNASGKAYAPYSGFFVGAAVLLDNATTVTGSNQENAAYPSGLCAERVALFHAGAAYPEAKVLAMAVTAQTCGKWVGPVSPCGACRQVLLETQARAGHGIRVLLCGAEQAYLIENAAELLPLAFGAESLKTAD
ncbi:MAG: cytidine deaminase [Tannerellaceae bacterium]|jgi:cytidine deaminase|nr:cytidine deaminase [Tannerellaceae bacterium]